MAVSGNPHAGHRAQPEIVATTFLLLAPGSSPSVHLGLRLQRDFWPGVPRPSAALGFNSVHVGRAGPGGRVGPEDGLPGSSSGRG